MSAFQANATAIAYLISAVLFIFALRGLSSPESSRKGNLLGILGMVIAIAATVLSPQIVTYGWIIGAVALGGGIGYVIARRIAMTAMPQLVAGFHSLVGMAAVLVAAAALLNPSAFGITDGLGRIFLASRIEMSLGAAIGAITFSGSVIAFLKLQGLMSGTPILLPARHPINLALAIAIIGLIVAFGLSEGAAAGGGNLLWWLIAASFVIGFLLIIPIGGADMPVVISMLNSYSGWAAAGIGFTLQNSALIVTGALVGSSGAILSYIMCKGMNRSFISVIAGGFGGDGGGGPTGQRPERPHKKGSADDAAFILKNAGSVIVVPGYGMAVAQAQHAVRELADRLKSAGVSVKYAIHPVAGRMPGHMNVLLAEANVPYDEVFELDDINNAFSTADVAFVIGANDVTNPVAKTDPDSPIYGMPILDVERAKTILFVKRSLSPGYAGVDNELFYRDNVMMLFGDAKKMTEAIIKTLD
ncbi:MAG: NAD(P)(+) transhydrogenase (Re/Si-specific) subunit beta [Proteobacteria bacterium]|nr:NAD(P)(+) transhydrogenase (Re/Si-specific) subunit beta [Pseudomonadota bacterium]